MTDAADVVAAYWAAAEARDWETFGALVAENVVYEAPQSRERVRGRAAYLRFNAEGFPGDWHLAVQRIVGGDREAVSLIQFSDAAGTQPGLCFFDLEEDGQIARITDFWPDPYEPPPGREHLAERY
jgi:hypothetical protein